MRALRIATAFPHFSMLSDIHFRSTRGGARHTFDILDSPFGRSFPAI
jgi:hypothetical protein